MEAQSILSDTSYQTAYDEYGDNLRIAAVSQSFIKTSRTGTLAATQTADREPECSGHRSSR
jgi:hypothetical protein